MLQDIAWYVSVVLITGIASVFLIVLNKSQLKETTSDSPNSTSIWRRRVFWILIMSFIPIISFSLKFLPYESAHKANEQPLVIVKVTGYQWRWDLSRNELPVGKLIEFQVTSADVNHGFSIYDSNMHLKTQTQAMPGFTNKLRYKFDATGTYRVLCMEYCGVAHHGMITEIKVVSN